MDGPFPFRYPSRILENTLLPSWVKGYTVLLRRNEDGPV